ncbi:hypothetical protein P7C70_g2123, partial [Phenoliferia sp. Uapishka_3]
MLYSAAFSTYRFGGPSALLTQTPMSSYPITSTRVPRAPFFRGRHSRTLSSSSLSSDQLCDSSQSDSSSSSSESGGAGGGTDRDFDHDFDSRVRRNSASTRSLSVSPGPRSPSLGARRPVAASGVTHTTNPSLTAYPSRRQHLKLSLSLLRARQSITCLSNLNNPQPTSSTTYESLSTSLKSLSTSLPSDLSTLGVFIPILYRLAKDLGDELGNESSAGGRERRRGMGKEEAKKLVGLRQRWGAGEETGRGSGKGKGRERDAGEADWVAEVVERVNKVPFPHVHFKVFSTFTLVLLQNPPPACLTRPYDRPTTALLNGIESLLLPSSLPRFGLGNLGLTKEYLAEWDLLNSIPEAISWYLSFDEASGDEEHRRVQAMRLLESVRSLDLSKNQLSGSSEFQDLPTLHPVCLNLKQSIESKLSLASHRPPTPPPHSLSQSRNSFPLQQPLSPSSCLPHSFLSSSSDQNSWESTSQKSQRGRDKK